MTHFMAAGLSLRKMTIKVCFCNFCSISLNFSDTVD